jgi:hypothetical protein
MESRQGEPSPHWDGSLAQEWKLSYSTTSLVRSITPSRFRLSIKLQTHTPQTFANRDGTILIHLAWMEVSTYIGKTIFFLFEWVILASWTRKMNWFHRVYTPKLGYIELNIDLLQRESCWWWSRLSKINFPLKTKIYVVCFVRQGPHLGKDEKAPNCWAGMVSSMQIWKWIHCTYSHFLPFQYESMDLNFHPPEIALWLEWDLSWVDLEKLATKPCTQEDQIFTSTY